MSRETKDLIVGLDIGTSKIVALVAEVSPEGRLNVIGIGSQESKGLKKGVVVNIEETVAAISRVVQEVELMADCKVKDVYTGIAGSHIRSFNSNGMVAIRSISSPSLAWSICRRPYCLLSTPLSLGLSFSIASSASRAPALVRCR